MLKRRVVRKAMLSSQNGIRRVCARRNVTLKSSKYVEIYLVSGKKIRFFPWIKQFSKFRNKTNGQYLATSHA